MDESLNAIIQRQRMYDAYATPRVSPQEYVRNMQYTPSNTAPDNYGFTDWVSNSFANWNKNRYSVMKDTALGDYVMADEDQTTINQARDYIQLDQAINVNLEKLAQDPYNENLANTINQLIQQRDQLLDSYNKVASGQLWDSKANDRINSMLNAGDTQGAIDYMNRLSLETLQNKKDDALFDADTAQQFTDMWDSKISSDYYRRKSENPGMDLTELDTYLYKLPGLMGSSAATLATDLATGAGTMAAYALGGPIGLALGATIAIAGNIYSRTQESKAEVYSNYKSKVQQAIEKAGIKDDVLKDARSLMRNSGQFTEDQINDDEFVYDQLLTGRININNITFDKARIDNTEGLQSLYMDNMALSINDIVQTAIAVMPFGKIAKTSKTINKAVEAANTASTGFKKAISDRIDDVLSFGIDNVNKLPRLTRRRNILDLGGRILVNSTLEGMEEGTQYIKGQRYINNEFEANPDYLKSYMSNIGAGARALFAALTPWDPVYSDDEEFLENFKGGAILGGAMTAVMGAPGTIMETMRQTGADRMLASIYADKLDKEDRIRKNMIYGKAIRENKWNNIQQSFDRLEQLGLDGISTQDIQEERDRAEQMRNILTAPTTLAQAVQLGIDPRTEDYDLFVALKDHYKQLKDESSELVAKSQAAAEAMNNRPEINQYVNTLLQGKKNIPENSAEAVKEAILLKSYREAYDAIKSQYNDEQKKLKQLEDNADIHTSRADVIEFKHVLSGVNDFSVEYKQALKNMSVLGITEDQLSVPQLHQDMRNANIQLIAANLQDMRADLENQIMDSTDKDAVQAKLNKFRGAQYRSERFIQRLNDFESGKVYQKQIDDGKEIIPEPDTTKSNTPEQTTIEQDPEPERTEVDDARDRISQQRSEVSESVDGHTRLTNQTPAGQLYNRASKLVEDEFLSRHPNVRGYKEYVATNELDTLTGPKYDALQELVTARDRMEEEVLTNGWTDEAQRLATDVEARIEDYESIVATEQNVIQQAQQEAQSERDLKRAQEAAEQAKKDTPQEQPLPKEEPKPLPPTVKPDKTEPAKVEEPIPSLADLMGELAGDAAREAMNSSAQPEPVATPEQNAQPISTAEPLTYDRRTDPYSHQLNYHLTVPVQENGMTVWKKAKYQDMEEYLNNDEFADVSTAPDFLEEVTRNGVEIVVRPYIHREGATPEEAIYVLFKYKDKKYVATVQTVEYGLRSHFRHRTKYTYAEQQVMEKNLIALRNKCIELYKEVERNPDLVLRPTTIRRTKGTVVNLKSKDNQPVVRKLTDVAWSPVKDPYKVTPENMHVGVSTGDLGNRDIRVSNRIISANGQALGAPFWEVQLPNEEGGTTRMITKLNTKSFKNHPKVVDTILDLLTSNARTYTDANGLQTQMSPLSVLTFLVNFGPKTATDPNSTKLSPERLRARMAKQFYMDENQNIVIGSNTYTISDLISVPEIRQQAKDYIMNNFHFHVDENALTKSYFGGGLQNPSKDHRFDGIEALLKSSGHDSLVIVPGEVELTLKDFGLMKDANGNVVEDTSLPKGISQLGWYIKEGIINTDAADYFRDANIYIDDVELVDRNRETTAQQAEQKVEEIKSSQVFDLPDMGGGRVKVDMDEIYKILDGKNRKGPNMATDTQEDPALLQTQEKLNPNQAKEWLQSTLGITPEIVQTVVDITEAGQAVVGRATEDSILLSTEAPVGTEYHEAWHRVSQLLISDKERRKLYANYNKKHNSNLSDTEIDEILAEQYRDFMLTESGNYDFKTKNWFRRILDFVKLWMRTGQYGLARIYSNIARGKYLGVEPNAENVERFRKIYNTEGPNLQINGVELQNITTIKQLNSITNNLVYAFFRTSFTDNNYLDYHDLDPKELRFDRLKLILEAQYSKTPNPVLREIIDKFESVFVPRVVSNLKTMGLRAIDRNENDTISDIEEGAENVNIGQHTVESMNISIKDNAPAEVKFFFQTVPEYTIDKDGQLIANIDPYTHFPNFVDPNRAWVRILKDLHGCRTMTSIVSRIAMYAQQRDPFYQALLFKLNNLIKNTASTDSDVATRAEATLTKIQTVITCDVNNFVTVTISRDKNSEAVSMQLKDNNVDIKAMTYPRVWSQYFFNNSKVFRYQEGNLVAYGKDTKHQLDVLIDNFNKLRSAFTNNRGILKVDDKDVDLHIPANLDRLKDMLVGYFNTIGIGIDKATINNLLLSGIYGDPSSDTFTLMSSFITSPVNFGGIPKLVKTLNAIKDAIHKDGTIGDITVDGNVIDPAHIYNDSGFVKELANFYAMTHATDRSLSSIGPDNSTYYMVSQNNFAKDRLAELTSDQETIDDLNTVVYNKGSIILQAVNQGNRDLHIETFINFKDTTSHDTGRDYFGITDREDYLAKMTAVLNDRIIFPTVADKKTYHFIRGVKLPHERITFTPVNGRTAVRFGNDALEIIRGYCYDELNRIELTLRQIDDDPKHVKIVDGKEVHVNEDGSINEDWLEPSRRIKNYHTPNKYEGKDGKIYEIEGNGARFLFFTGIYTSDGFISFNDPTKSARENLQKAKDYFFNLTPETQKAFLSSILNKRVKEEMQTAKNMGLIDMNDNGDIWSARNLLLDTGQIEQRKQYYTGTDANNAEGYAVYDIIADYTINSIISVTEVEKMFSGDPAYYKVAYSLLGPTDVSIDKIKRLGSLTSTGLNNRLDFNFDPIDTEYTVAELKDHEIADRQYFVLEDLFTKGSIKESIQELEGEEAWNAVKDKTIQEIEKIYPNAVKWARTKAKKEVAGYKKGINVADAAVYISPNMTKNLLRMRGVWSPEIKHAFEILTNPETADKWESDPKLYAEANKVILNVMKYVAFGTRFNEIPGLGIPYFNKMALFPLFKSVATGDIKALYDRMVDESNPIDMVMFNSAVKAGSRDPQKAYRQAKDSEIELKDGQTVLSGELTNTLTLDRAYKLTDFNTLTTYKQRYKYIRQQLETNPHTHEEQLLGTQFMKVNLSNLRMGDMYGKAGDQVTGQEIKDTVMHCLNKLSDMGRQKMEAELFNQDGTVNLNKLANDLRSTAADSDMDDNTISGLTMRDGDLDTPLDAISNNSFLESRYISKVNKTIIDVHMPGGAFIQRSAFGLEATSLDVVTEDMINDGKPLLTVNEKDGSMDSVVSINLFKHIIPGYSEMTFTQARQWLIDHNIIGQNAEATAIGYRIPTQSVASISALRFVDVFPEIMGDTIMLPESFTKLTGSDLLSGFEPV